MKGMVERREHNRFRAENGATAVFRRPWPRSFTLGQIIDVSMGGLAFRYIADRVRSRGSHELEIVWGDCSSRLDNIPFKTISDCEMHSKASLNFATRRCGMQFMDLTDKQKSDLRYFIQNHTTADPEG